MRDGRVAEFGPNRNHPHPKGSFCIKGIRGAPGIAYAASRLHRSGRAISANNELCSIGASASAGKYYSFAAPHRSGARPR
jgi:hypothetical protein